MVPTIIRGMTLKRVAPKLRNIPKPIPQFYDSRYKPKKVWPPDFSKLSEKEQFRFERRYKRRMKLATARPRWDKYVKLTQLFSVTFVLIYSVLFMDWQRENQPLQGVRDVIWGALGAFSPEQRHERRKPDIEAITNTK
ncbi:uncharacterized protein F4822DRAFT_98118 [Hypoxylon trugodes]|uniref:uncharacterized protein n=1 Tax=Hypoxylon trugodes TaxID=326681 RepID=UPI002192C3A7|nr:uncharacterized protein F4822DRAFT_98118 [Hypoxylon trugodes]KAI1382832.1 hypothetical protein F4822DRAFT_98118 [Hypoxylon trugodes]